MKVEETPLPGVKLIHPAAFADERGFFMETWHRERYRQAGFPDFVQDNLSFSRKGVLRGLHFQHPHPQGKLVQALAGEIFDVAVDIRQGSPTFGRWVGYRLSGENRLQLYIPEGFAHGFCVLSETALVAYKCSDLYHPEADQGLRWNDPHLAIEWPIRNPILSPKDAAAPFLSQHPHLPRA